MLKDKLCLPSVNGGEGALVPFVDETLSLDVGLWFIKSCTIQILRRRLVESLVVSQLDYCSVMYLDALYLDI